jgi:tRNA (mo5U34)-methyltransferase
MKYLQHLPTSIDYEPIIKRHQQLQTWVNQSKKGFLLYRTPYEQILPYQADYVDCRHDCVMIGKQEEIAAADQRIIEQTMRAFMPWRKGPFSVFGIDIDAEWQSNIKWQRLLPLPDLKDKIIADIGCNNGYYMFRMSPDKPKLVLGFEPSIQHYYCFKTLNHLAGLGEMLQIDLLGVEDLALFGSCFDIIFLMGIIYHRSSPIDTLRDVYQALNKDGVLLLESQCIPGNEHIALFPEKTYAKVAGTYFVPTGACLLNWLRKAGFKNVKICGDYPMSINEQRRTDWMQFESYQDFIDPDNEHLTVEGYPAPHRIFMRAVK